MSAEQYRAYADADRIDSDPWGIFDRDNRNHRRKRELIERRTAAAPGDAVLEVGCGHGLHARRYADRYDLTAVDLSPSLCRETRARADADVVQADATDLPFADDAFEAVVGSAILHHLPTPVGALQEWQRVARSSVTLTEPNYLFPKDLVTTHLVPEEGHKRNMAPWRLEPLLDAVTDAWSVEHRLYTPPWPRALTRAYERVDAALRAVPAVRRLMSQLLLIHLC